MLELGKGIGLLNTLLIIGSTGFFGIFLAKQQGLQTISELKYFLRNGEIPQNQVIEGLLILIGSVLLLTPGLITDSVGFLLLLPWSRIYFREVLRKKIKTWLRNGTFNIHYSNKP